MRIFLQEGVLLAISNFLRQHDLVQVQWVFLSSTQCWSTPARCGEVNVGWVQVQASKNNIDSGLPLRFDRTLVIVGAGAVDLELLRELHDNGAAIVAADGGADICALGGITPQAIIGDMDSLANKEGWAQKTRLFEIKEQETTDFEKCLYSTKARINIALGMVGKRLDHTLAALDAAARYGADRHIILIGEEDLTLVVTGDFTFTVARGARVSIHPLGVIRFARSKGLEFSLDDVGVAPGLKMGTSNCAVAGEFEIIPQQGGRSPYLLILEKQYLGDLIEKLEL